MPLTRKTRRASSQPVTSPHSGRWTPNRSAGRPAASDAGARRRRARGAGAADRRARRGRCRGPIRAAPPLPAARAARRWHASRPSRRHARHDAEGEPGRAEDLDGIRGSPAVSRAAPSAAAKVFQPARMRAGRAVVGSSRRGRIALEPRSSLAMMPRSLEAHSMKSWKFALVLPVLGVMAVVAATTTAHARQRDRDRRARDRRRVIDSGPTVDGQTPDSSTGACTQIASWPNVMPLASTMAPTASPATCRPAARRSRPTSSRSTTTTSATPRSGRPTPSRRPTTSRAATTACSSTRLHHLGRRELHGRHVLRASGSLTITNSSEDEVVGRFTGTGTNLKLVEWDAQADAPVTGGRCYEIASLTFDDQWDDRMDGGTAIDASGDATVFMDAATATAGMVWYRGDFALNNTASLGRYDATARRRPRSRRCARAACARTWTASTSPGPARRSRSRPTSSCSVVTTCT